MSMFEPRDTRGFRDRISKSLEGEIAAGEEYDYLVFMANDLGLDVAARTLRSMADDERRHYDTLARMAMSASRLKWSTTPSVPPEYPEYRRSGYGKPAPSRPFPTNYGDWVSLAEDLKDVDPAQAYGINVALDHIRLEDISSEDSKRFLVSLAGEYGVR